MRRILKYSHWWMLLMLPLSASAAAAWLSRGNGPEPATLDPHRAQDVSALNVLRDLCEGLHAPSRSGGLELGQARAVERSADGRRVVYTLRSGLRWSDGAALTSADFVASLERLRDPRTGSPWTASYAHLTNVAAAGPDRLVLTLAEPDPALAQRLALPAACPVRVDREGRVLEVGTGAFRLRSRRPQQALELERNPFFRAAAAVVLDGVTHHVTADAQAEYRRYLAGELHLTETIPPGRSAWLRERHGGELRLNGYAGMAWLNLNLRRSPLDHPDLRRALALAIDREVLTEVVLGSGQQPSFSIVPDVLWARAAPADSRSGPTQAERVQQARRLWAGLESAPQSVELRYNANPEQRRLMQAIALMWQQVLGLRTRLRPQEWTAFIVTRRNQRATEVFRGGLIADLADPVAFLANFETDAGFNFGGIADPAFDAELAAARRAPSLAERERRAQAAEQRLIDAMVVIPLYQLVSRHLVAPAVIGFTPHPLDHHPSRFLRLAAQPPRR